jgi:hypothetical protein
MWSQLKRKESIMKLKLARIAAVIAIALPMASAFAADSSAGMGTTGTRGANQTQAAADQHKWYQAGERALQEQRERAALDAEGFPQYNP